MENKYYTPSIEEFCVGYEFELKCWITNICEEAEEGVHYRWDKTYYAGPEHWIFDKEIVFGSHVTYTTPVGVIRTKYLDKEDIESLGWVYTGNTSYTSHFEKKLPIGKLVLSFDERVRIEYQGPCGDVMLKYYGQLKSVNELRTLMSWLSIV